MKLGLYISQLLPENETVIVPGFGAFSLIHKPAEIREEEEQVLPPSKEISFNSKIRNNDGLLVEYVAHQEDISHFDALKKIEEERDFILYQLDKGERVTIENIGLFYPDDANEIHFEPASDENLDLESYGLNIASLKEPEPEEKQEEIPKEEAPVAETSDEQDGPAKEDEKPEPADEPEFEPVEQLAPRKNNEPERQQKRGWLWLLLILLPLAAAGIYMYVFQKKTKPDTVEIKIEKPSSEEQTIPFSDSTGIVPAAPSETIENQQEYTENSINTITTEPGKFYLIGGSFKEEENANKYFSQLQDEGYQPFHLGKKGNYYLVGIGTYNSEAEAVKAQNNFLEKHPGSGAWVFEKLNE